MRAMINCVISTDDGTALVDLRGVGAEAGAGADLDFPDAERLLEALEPYSEGGHVTRIVVDARGHDPLPAPMEILLMGLYAQALRHGAVVEVRRGRLRALEAAS
jgi:hypothetical protein